MRNILMRLVYHQEGMSQLEMGQFLQKDVAAIKRNLDIFEKKELILRTPVFLCKNTIYLAEKGRGRMPKVLKIVQQTLDEVLEDVSQEIYETAIRFLKHIYEYK